MRNLESDYVALCGTWNLIMRRYAEFVFWLRSIMRNLNSEYTILRGIRTTVVRYYAEFELQSYATMRNEMKSI